MSSRKAKAKRRASRNPPAPPRATSDDQVDAAGVTQIAERVAAETQDPIPQRSAIQFSSPGAAEPTWRPLLAVALVTSATLAVHWPVLSAPLLAHDRAIVGASAFQSPGSVGDALFFSGAAVGPVVNASFALSHALAAGQPIGYHAVDLLIHTLATILLLLVVRQSLLTTYEWFKCSSAKRRADAATPIALIAALVWTIHPLTTAAVAQVGERANCLTTLLLLAMLYAVGRAARSNQATIARGLWSAAAVVACLLGMLTSAAFLVAPLVALAYDRTFYSGGFRAALAERLGLYLSLAATASFAVVALLMAGLPSGYDVGAASASPAAYFLSQPSAICHYLLASVWPVNLSCDYGAEQTLLVRAAPAAALVFLLLAASVWLFFRQPRAAFGVAFAWLTLAANIVVGCRLAAVDEARMYAPLVGLVSFAVIAGDRLFHWLSWPRWSELILATAATIALGWLTVSRVAAYGSDVALWQNAVANAPDSATARYQLGAALAGAGRDDEAIAAWRRATELDPRLANAWLALGEAYLRHQETDHAIGALRRAVELAPQLAIGHWRLAQALRAQGSQPAALAELGSAVAASPFDANYQLGLANALASAGKYDEALDHCRLSLQVAPANNSARNTLAALLDAVGQTDSAIDELRKVVAADPNYAEARLNLATLLRRQGRAKDADDQQAAAVRLNPKLAQASPAPASAAPSNSDSPARLADLERAAKANPSDADAQFALGAELARQGLFDRAREALAAAVGLRPDSATFHARYAAVLLRLDDRNEAMRQFKTALDQDPRSAEAHVGYGLLLAKLDLTDAAIEHFQRALQIDPDDVKAHNNLALAFDAAGRTTEAIEHYQAALKLEPKSVELRFNLGLALAHAGKPGEALDQWRQAMKLQPDNPLILYRLAWTLATSPRDSIRDGHEALDFARRAVELTKSDQPQPLDALAAALAETGQYEEAAKTAEKAADLASAQGASQLDQQIFDRLRLYRAGKPYREPEKRGER